MCYIKSADKKDLLYSLRLRLGSAGMLKLGVVEPGRLLFLGGVIPHAKIVS